MHLRIQHYCLIVLVAGTVMLSNLGGPRLWDRDEPRNAGCAAEMLARGDWIVPVFNAEQRTHKPVLLYWLIMSSYSLLGVNEFAARLPSALLAIGTALCTYEMGRRLFSPRAGLWSGLAVATSILFVVAGRAATPDSTLIFCSTLALTIFVAACFPESEQAMQDADASRFQGNAIPRNWSSAAAMYGCMGLAVLGKGPVGIVLPTAVIGMFLLVMRRAPVQFDAGYPVWKKWISGLSVFEPRHFLRTCWCLRPLTAIGICLLVAAPWYVGVGLRTDGEFLRSFFFEHNIGRALQTMEGHRGNVLFYPLAILVGFFPWSVFTVPLLIDLLQRLRARDTVKTGYVFAICWIGVYVGVFSLARTKLPSYVTPCYPALALLAGVFIDRLLARACLAPRFWQFAALCVFTLVGVVATVAIPIVVHPFFPGEEWLGIVGLFLCVGGGLSIWNLRRNQESAAAYCFVGGAATFLVALFGIAAARVGQHQMADRLWATIHATSHAPRVAAFACLEPSWVFYGGHAIDEISHEQVGPTHAPWVERDGRWQPKGPVRIADVVKDPRDSFVITTGEQLERVQKLLPSDFQVLETVPFFLKDDRLVLLGRSPSASIAHRTAHAQQRR